MKTAFGHLRFTDQMKNAFKHNNLSMLLQNQRSKRSVKPG